MVRVNTVLPICWQLICRRGPAMELRCPSSQGSRSAIRPAISRYSLGRNRLVGPELAVEDRQRLQAHDRPRPAGPRDRRSTPRGRRLSRTAAASRSGRSSWRRTPPPEEHVRSQSIPIGIPTAGAPAASRPGSGWCHLVEPQGFLRPHHDRDHRRNREQLVSTHGERRALPTGFISMISPSMSSTASQVRELRHRPFGSLVDGDRRVAGGSP